MLLRKQLALRASARLMPAAAAMVPFLPGVPKLFAAGGWGTGFYALVFLGSSLLHGEPRLLERAAATLPEP
jgi:hypothetical protein